MRTHHLRGVDNLPQQADHPNIERKIGLFPDTEDPAVRLGKAGFWSVISARSRRRGFRTISTIHLLDTGNTARIAGCLRSVRWIGSGSESGRTETGSDSA